MVDGSLSRIVGNTAAIGVWFIVTMVSGRTVGDLAVELRYAGGPLPEPVARLTRFAGGIGGLLVLGALPEPWSLTAPVFGIVAVVLVFTTAAGRGLPGVLSRREVVDARA